MSSVSTTLCVCILFLIVRRLFCCSGGTYLHLQSHRWDGSPDDAGSVQRRWLATQFDYSHRACVHEVRYLIGRFGVSYLCQLISHLVDCHEQSITWFSSVCPVPVKKSRWRLRLIQFESNKFDTWGSLVESNREEMCKGNSKQKKGYKRNKTICLPFFFYLTVPYWHCSGGVFTYIFVLYGCSGGSKTDGKPVPLTLQSYVILSVSLSTGQFISPSRPAPACPFSLL